MESIKISNRYFLSRHDAPQSLPAELHPNIDPAGPLKSLASRDFIHTEDNQVQYYEFSESSGKYITCKYLMNKH
jgi:hypothetical protein